MGALFVKMIEKKKNGNINKSEINKSRGHIYGMFLFIKGS